MMLQVEEKVVEEVAARGTYAREIVDELFPLYKKVTATLGDVVRYGASYYLVCAREDNEAPLGLVNVDDRDMVAGCYSSMLNRQIHKADRGRIIFKANSGAVVLGKFQEIYKVRGTKNG